MRAVTIPAPNMPATAMNELEIIKGIPDNPWPEVHPEARRLPKTIRNPPANAYGTGTPVRA